MQNQFVRITGLILIFCFSFSVLTSQILVAKQNSEIAREEWGYLKVITKHTGLAVKVDGNLLGFTQLEVQTLKPGRHKVRVSHPSPATWFDQDWTSEIEILTGDTLTIEILFKNSYSIHSQPFGASVLLNNGEIGETPTFFKLDENRTGVVTLSKAGYRDTTFTVGKSEQQFFDIQLKNKKEIADLNLASGEPALKKRSKHLLFAAMGVSLVSGALGIYFRNKGDDKFEEYLGSGNPARFNKSFDNAKKFDRYAGVAFVAFQVSFLASFYLFLKNVNN